MLPKISCPPPTTRPWLFGQKVWTVLTWVVLLELVLTLVTNFGEIAKSASSADPTLPSAISSASIAPALTSDPLTASVAISPD